MMKENFSGTISFKIAKGTPIMNTCIGVLPFKITVLIQDMNPDAFGLKL